MRLLLLCPGRGSYGKDQLGSLAHGSPVLDTLDAYRADLGRPTLREMDAAERYGAKLHVAGENASILTFGATAADLEALDPDKAEIVAVGGNSMGWYTALYAAGALSLLEAARLIETMGQYQARNVVGGQVLYPLVDEQWRPSPELQAHVQTALRHNGVYLSIALGGTAVLAGDRQAVRTLLKELPKLQVGKRQYPIQLPFHSAFHTPLMYPASQRGQDDLVDLELGPPKRPMIDGQGRLVQTWANPSKIWDWTLGPQVVDTYDFSATVRTGVQNFAPDAILLPGPGDTLGASVAQTLIEIGWRGLRDKRDFLEAQRSGRPVILSMTRADQRALIV